MSFCGQRTAKQIVTDNPIRKKERKKRNGLLILAQLLAFVLDDFFLLFFEYFNRNMYRIFRIRGLYIFFSWGVTDINGRCSSMYFHLKWKKFERTRAGHISLFVLCVQRNWFIETNFRA